MTVSMNQASFATNPIDRTVLPSIPVVAAAPWDGFVGSHPAGHLLQTSGWGQLKQQFGWQAEGIALLDEQQQIRAGALLLLRRSLGLTLAYVPKGPLVDWQDPALTAELIIKLIEKSRRLGASVLKLEPELPDTPVNRSLLAGYGFRPSRQTIQPRSTTLIPIDGTETAILDAMKSKWRYNIRLAQRKGVVVRAATQADLPAINALMTETGARDGFAVHSAAYYSAAYDLLVPRHAVFLLAEYQGQPLAAIVVAAVGNTAYYLWGASSDRERNRMPNHALQWAGIQWARQRGAHWYDFWGIPDDVGKVALGVAGGDGSGTPVDALPLDLEAFPSGDLWGVYRFKQGFGGKVVRAVGAWDLPLRPVGYQLYASALFAREQIQTLQQFRQPRKPDHVAEPAASTVPTAFPRLTSELVATKQAWQQTLASLPTPHVLQSWEWGAIKGQTEWVAERLALRQGNETRGAFQFLSRQPIPALPLRIGYIPKGPVIDWQDFDLVEAALAQIEAHARARNCIFVKIDPDVREDTTAGRIVLHTLARRGWRFSDDQIQFKNTAVSELRGDEAALLERVKSKWRYNIRLAERRGVQIRQGTSADLPAFYQLYAETGQRDHFLIRPFAYYRATWESFLAAQAEADNPAGGLLLLAEHAEETAPLAALFLFRYGQRTWYFYGASSDRRRRDMPNYLLQWEAMRWALLQGCTSYDWWGAPTDLADPTDQLQGVWQFKQGFDAQFQPHIGAWDFPVQPTLYQLYRELFPVALDLARKAIRWRSRGGAATTQATTA
ncbi:MAG: peptidoglycan bridge formation glycyltransferase FemA/FemB family protein [Caldilineaceae bacterium]|nr:peptidoglycan bridge formation glycyltransferase FemA/FemB family protein [Caldilineaceae bacterium]